MAKISHELLETDGVTLKTGVNIVLETDKAFTDFQQVTLVIERGGIKFEARLHPFIPSSINPSRDLKFCLIWLNKDNETIYIDLFWRPRFILDTHLTLAEAELFFDIT